MEVKLRKLNKVFRRMDTELPIVENKDALDSTPTLNQQFTVTIRGWEDDKEEEARDFGQRLCQLTREISNFIDLSRLDRIVIGSDYHEALASVNGEQAPAPTPTANEYGNGAAMATNIFRGDEVWSVVVIWTPLVRAIFDHEDPNQPLALHTFVHELIHVDDTRLFTTTYPGGWRAAKPRDARDAALQTIVHPCQAEYRAQRRSAFAAPEQGLMHMSMLKEVMSDVDEQVRKERLAYRLHGDVASLWKVVSERLGFLFQSLGYALGHADWVLENRDDHPELASKFDAEIEALREMSKGWLIDASREAVQPLFNLTEWTNMDVYDPLIAVAERLLNEYRMFTSLREDDLYIDMPYTGIHDL
ncbi:hypothetical protein [Rhizobium croatiense]|uniref:hypothetical protein n=1 Tax=Rhizobium croatiense TaxID=2867516 RepID=UPI001FED78A3|nr:hypothetical protein [Rhizobium croatiense]